MIQFSLSQCVGIITVVALVVPAAIYVGKLSQKVSGHDDSIREIKSKLDDIWRYVRNGKVQS